MATADQLAQKLTAKAPRPRCRATGCTTPLDPVLVDREDNTGLHMMCNEPAAAPTPVIIQPELSAAKTGCQECIEPDEDPAPWCDCRSDETCKGPCRRRAHAAERCPQRAAVPPPSTVDELHHILIGYDASRPRSMQVRLGPSELGTECQQQIARKLAAAPRRPVTAPAWAPFQGTAVHAEMEEVVAYWNAELGRVRWLAEDDLHVDGEIRGHGDAYDLDHDMVVDWKHVGTTALNKLRAARRAGKSPAEQVSPEYRVQAHLYGVGHERKGRPVKFVRLVLLARSWQFSDSDEWTEPYQPEIALRALDRYYATKDLLATFDVANNPHLIGLVPATPSADACKWCPFHRPNLPSGWDGCAGHVVDAQRAIARQLDGLIAP